jgi:DNA polymerase-3 subunit delta
MLASMAALKPVYLITGTDRPKIETALGRLRGHFDATAVELLSGIEVSGEDAVAACNTLGLFGGDERLVVVEDVDGRANSDGRLTGGWKAPDVNAVAEYLADPAAGTVLALVGQAVKGDSALAKACAKAGEVLVYDAPREKDLPTWVARRFESLGAKVGREACRALVEVVGDDLLELASEIEKLATWAGGTREIGEAEVRELAVGLSETAGFELTDAWGRRDVPAVLLAAESMLERSVKPRRDGAARIVGLLVNHVDRVRECQRLDGEGISAKDAAARLKRHPFYVQKLYAQARNFDVDELRGVVTRLAALDHAVKGGSPLASDLELERALVDVTAPAGAAAAAR